MAFSVTGLPAMITDLKAQLAAAAPLNSMTNKEVFVLAYNQGAKYGMPLDESTLTALFDMLDTPANLSNALALQEDLDVKTAADAAADTAATAANTARTTGITAATSARDAFAPV